MSEAGSAANGSKASSPARSGPPAAAPPPAPPLISPTGSPGLNCVIDVVNSTAAPFQNAPDPKKGVAGKIENAIGMVTGVLGAPDKIIDTAFAAITAPVAAVFPSLPAITLTGLHVGSPHTHAHPPSFIPPAPPVPLPSLGMMLGAGSVTVLIGGMPAARAGDIGLAITCGSLAPPFEVYTGSSNVFIGGARAARMGDITKHCNPTSSASLMEVALAAASMAAGAAAMSTGGGTAALAQGAADAAIMAVKALAGKDPGLPPGMGALIGPPVPNVLIGGFPCPGIGAMVTSAFKAGLKKGLGKLKNAVKSKLAARKANGCKGDGTHPVYLVTGENFDQYTDFASAGLFNWRRHYTSARGSQDGPLGFGWRHIYQCRLERRLHRATFTDWQGLSTEFPRFELGANQTWSDGYVLHRLARGHFRLTHRQDPALEFEGGEFDSVLALRRVVQGEQRIDFEYDAQGRLVAALESERGKIVRRFEFRYSPAGRIQEVCEVDPAAVQRGALGRQPMLRARYQYSPQGDLIGAENALAGAWSYRYDAFHRLTHQSDPRGYAYSYSYDANGRCTDASGQDGLWWCHIQYFPERSFTRYTEGDNATYEYHYDGDGVITKIVDPYGGELLRQLDAEGRLVSEVDSGGRTVRWLYDADGAHFARVDRFGNLFPPELEQPRPPNPFARRLPSTSFGWLFEGHPAPSAGALLGAPSSSLDAIPAELQHYARGCFRTQSASLDPALLTEPGAVRIDRDALGRKIRETDVLGRTRRWHYDATGNLISERDRDGSVSTCETTSWNLLGTRRNPIGATLQYEYSKLEQIVAITDPLGNQSRYEYDLKERLVRVHRHGQLREEYVYDVGDHFIEKRDGQGRVLFTNAFHESHFVAVRKLASGGEHRFGYDERGRIIEASTDAHRIQIHYDGSGRRVSDQRDDLGVEHRYLGQRGIATTIAGHFQLRSSSAPKATELMEPAGSKTRIDIEPSGLVRRTCGNGTIELLQYDERGRLEGRLCHRRDGYGRYRAWATRYTYSAEGDLVQIADSQSGTTAYEVDAAHRLVAESAPDGKRRAFRFDGANNLLSKPGLDAFELDAGNRLRASRDETFTYDERNHLAERRSSNGSVTRYTYDSFDLLVRIERTAAELSLWPPQLDPKANLAAFPDPNKTSSTRPPDLDWHAAYDALGRRLWTQWGNARREFLWDGDRLAAERLPSGIFRIYQYASPNALTPLGFTDYDSLDAPLDSGRPYHVFSNPVGIPLLIEDARAVTVWRAQRIDPYGAIELEPGAALEYNLRWPGHYYDPETGLHYNRYRSYDPALGRYLQSDPVGYAGSPLNLYAYCPNPLVQVDVLGLDHDAKASRTGKESPEDVDGKEGTASDNPAPRSSAAEPTAEERALAASHGDTSAHRDAREKVVRHFYGDKPGLGQKRAEQDMGYGGDPPRANGNPKGYGIDLGKPLHVQDVPPPAQVQQNVKSHGYPGNFCDPEGGQSMDALGLNSDPTMRQPKTFDVPPTDPKQQGLVSTAGPVIDDWTDTANPVRANGGGTQMTIDDTTKTGLSPQPQPW